MSELNWPQQAENMLWCNEILKFHYFKFLLSEFSRPEAEYFMCLWKSTFIYINNSFLEIIIHFIQPEYNFIQPELLQILSEIKNKNVHGKTVSLLDSKTWKEILYASILLLLSD